MKATGTMGKRKRYDVIVIGGGIAGLTVAYNLTKLGRKVLVIEKEKELGGALRSKKMNGSYLELAYHHIFDGDNITLKLIKSLGLKNDLYTGYPYIGFYYKNKIHNLTKNTDLIGFKPLSVMEKFRLGIVMVMILLSTDMKKLDHIPTKEWLIKWGGKSLYNKFFLPMIKGKFGDTSDRTSTAWFVSRIKLRAKRGKKGEKLTYLMGGFYRMIERLAEEIKQSGGEIIINKRIEKIIVKNESVVGVKVSGTIISTGSVVSTIPPEKFLKLARFPDAYVKKLSWLEYQGTIAVVIGLKKKLSKFYWTNIIDRDLKFAAIIEHTNFIHDKAYGDSKILYLGSYPNKSSEIWGFSKRKIFDIYFNDLKKLFPNIMDDDVLWWEVEKFHDAGLIYNTGLLGKIPSLKTPIQGLYAGGMFNSYPERSIEKSIQIGEHLAKLVVKYETTKG